MLCEENFRKGSTGLPGRAIVGRNESPLTPEAPCRRSAGVTGPLDDDLRKDLRGQAAARSGQREKGVRPPRVCGSQRQRRGEGSWDLGRLAVPVFPDQGKPVLTLIEESHGTLTTVIDDILGRRPGFFERVEELLRAAVEWSRKDPDLLNLSVACTTEELAPLAASSRAASKALPPNDIAR